MAFHRETTAAAIVSDIESVDPEASLEIFSIAIAAILVAVIFISFVFCREGLQRILELF